MKKKEIKREKKKKVKTNITTHIDKQKGERESKRNQITKRKEIYITNNVHVA